MKKIITIIPLFALISCTDTVETPPAAIDHPKLVVEPAFDALQEESVSAELDAANSEQILYDILLRFMNVVDHANQTTDVISESFATPIKFKSPVNTLYIQNATNNLCSDSQGSNEAQIWDDKDDSGNISKGDIWYYRIIDCQTQSTSAKTTGLISQTGMFDLLANVSEDDLSSTVNTIQFPDTFSGYTYNLHIQIDPQAGSIAYFKNTTIVYSKTENDIADSSTAVFSSGSLIGVNKTIDSEDSSKDKTFMFDIEKADLNNDNDESILTLSLVATYYDSEYGKVEVTTDSDLVFSYSYKGPTDARDEANPFSSISLSAGSINIESNDITASLTVDASDQDMVSFVFDNNASTEVLTPQSEYFNVGIVKNEMGEVVKNSFSLANMAQ